MFGANTIDALVTAEEKQALAGRGCIDESSCMQSAAPVAMVSSGGIAPAPTTFSPVTLDDVTKEYCADAAISHDGDPVPAYAPAELKADSMNFEPARQNRLHGLRIPRPLLEAAPRSQI